MIVSCIADNVVRVWAFFPTRSNIKGIKRDSPDTMSVGMNDWITSDCHGCLPRYTFCADIQKKRRGICLSGETYQARPEIADAVDRNQSDETRYWN
jgi:hypothetical protein